MGPARSPRALGPHAGFRALACCSISALPGLPAATSPCRSPLSLLPPSLPPFLARSWPGRAPPRAAAGRTRASGKPLGRRGRSAHGAGQVRGALGAPAGNRGNPVRTPPVPSRVPQEPSEFPPQVLPHRTDPVCIPTWMPSDSLSIRTRILRIPSVFHPDPSEPLSISAASLRRSLIPARIPPRPPLPGSRLALAGRWLLWSRDAGRSANRDLAWPGPARWDPRVLASLGRACQLRPGTPSQAASPGLTGFYFGLPGLGSGAPDVARCTQTGAAHRAAAVGSPPPGSGRCKALASWKIRAALILEPPGTKSFSSGCTCCWRPVICRGLVRLGLCQSRREKQSRARSCPFYLFGFVSLWANGESCFK